MNRHSSSPLSMPPHGPVEPRRDTPPPCRGSPVHVVRATVPSQIPLRSSESHSETISAPSQCRTLETLSEALRLAYSASGPPHRHTARRSTTGHTMRSSRTALHPRCRHEPRGCDLNSVNETEITPHKAVFDDEGNRLLSSAGAGEGVRPHDTARGVGRPGPRTNISAGNQRYGVVNEPCSGPVGPCCWTSFL